MEMTENFEKRGRRRRGRKKKKDLLIKG